MLNGKSLSLSEGDNEKRTGVRAINENRITKNRQERGSYLSLILFLLIFFASGADCRIPRSRPAIYLSNLDFATLRSSILVLHLFPRIVSPITPCFAIVLIHCFLSLTGSSSASDIRDVGYPPLPNDTTTSSSSVTGRKCRTPNPCFPPSCKKEVWQPIIAMLLLFTFSTEVTRIRSPAGKVNKFVMRAFRPFMRSHETHQFSGTGYYLFGVAVVSLLFSTTSACVGIMCLASLDPIAALMGSAFQPHVPQARMRNGKSIAGFLFSATTAILVVTLMLTQATYTNMTSADMYMIGFFVGFAGAFTELIIPSPQFLIGGPKFPLGIDDNAIIPIVSAAVCELLLQTTSETAALSPLLLWNPF